jgi:cysteine desulfurase family protein
MPASARLYLDNAATSWPKPEAVYQAVDDYQRRLGAPAGRGAYAEAAQTERIILSCRKKIVGLIGATDPARIIFTQNGTDSLNIALHGLLRPGDHVVTTVCEHNSVLRPLRFLGQRGMTTTYVACNSEGYIDPAAIEQAITPKTRLIALIHASNVTGAIQPVEAVGQIAARRNVFYLVDAAQSLGHVPIDVAALGCHLLAAPGHKGLLGPLGTGVLYLAPGIEQHLLPLRQGGTGTRSDEDIQPLTLPDRYESGNLNALGIIGLEAGVSHVMETGPRQIQEHSRVLVEQLLAGLKKLAGVQVHGPQTAAARVGVVSITVASYDPQELSALLDAQWSIQTRAGLHCAPRMHAALGTLPGGTLRLSAGHFTTPDQIDAALSALADITA